MVSGAPDETEVLARRIDLLELLADAPRHKADIVDGVDQSRSTVNRAVKELEDAGLVERVTPGYVATQAGRLAASTYREFVAQQRSILDAHPVLEGIPHDAELPMELLSEGRVETRDPRYRLFELVADRTRTADRCQIVLPELLDSRHLRVCHAGVTEDDLEVTVYAPESVLTDIAGEFPYLWNELRDENSFRPKSADTPPFGLFTWFADGEATAATLAAPDRNGISGYLDTDGPAGIQWIQDRIDDLDVVGCPANDQSDPNGTDLTPLAGTQLPSRLRAQGFTRIDDRYFQRREPMEPTTAWRVGLDVPEVAAGYAVERTVDGPSVRGDDGEPATLTEDLMSRLQHGQDTALLGPPGAGKSTICKSVVCEWHENGIGPVFHRESGAGQAFESPAALEAAVQGTDGTTLVVVEDAVRPEANDVFESMRALRGDQSTVFLLDARESEWRDPEEFPIDARLRAFRREAVDTVSMPALVERDCRRLIDRVETLTGERLAVDAAALLSDLRGEATDADAGVLPLLFHRLTQYLDPLGTADGSTSLDEDVDRVRRDLAATGDVALDVGVLVNTLNAAGLGIYPEYVLAPAAEEGRSRETVREALEQLEGQLLFSAPADDDPYRGIHETWSVRFLERFVEADGEAVAREHFWRGLSAVVDLSGGSDRTDRVARVVSGSTPALDRVVVNPQNWVDDLLETVFELGETYAGLAPLYGTSEGTGVDPSAVCSPETEVRCRDLRGRMLLTAADYERAREEFEGLAARSDELPDGVADRARAKALLGQGQTLTERGAYEEAREFYETGLSVAKELDDSEGEADNLYHLGRVASSLGEYDRAREYYEESLAIRQEVGDRSGEADSLENLGVVAGKQGAYDQSLAISREIGDRKGEAIKLNNLGLVARCRGAYEEARGYCEESLDISREIGDRKREANSLNHLGLIACRHGKFEESRRYHEQSLEIKRDIGDREGEAGSLDNIGSVTRRQGDYDKAREFHEEALAIARDIGDREREANALDHLGIVARRRGDYERAREYLEEALAIARDIGERKHEATSLGNLGILELRRGECDQAREHLEAALEISRDLGDPEVEVDSLRGLGALSRQRGLAEGESKFDQAREFLERALAVHDLGESGFELARVRLERARLALARGDHETARERAKHAQDRFAALEASHFVARSLLVRGRLAGASDAPEVAREHLQAALETFETVDAPQDELAALRLLVETFQGRDDSDREREWYDRARTVLDDAPRPVAEMHEEWARQQAASLETS